jgi:hypothetical protein
VGLERLAAGLEAVATAIGELAACDPSGPGDEQVAAQVLAVRRLGDQLDAAWLAQLRLPSRCWSAS